MSEVYHNFTINSVGDPPPWGPTEYTFHKAVIDDLVLLHQNFTGTRGVTGAQGLTGSQGFTGAPGTTGIRGLTGIDGITGIRGLTGIDGITGIRGLTGINGLTGLQGYTGLVGVTGIIGFTGINGITGVIGLTGLNGTTGSQGITGLIGNTGIIGVTGLIGSTGIIGFTGSQGLTGLSGAGGLTGSGSIGSFAIFDPINALGDSIVSQNSGKISIGATPGAYLLNLFTNGSGIQFHNVTTGSTLTDGVTLTYSDNMFTINNLEQRSDAITLACVNNAALKCGYDGADVNVHLSGANYLNNTDNLGGVASQFLVRDSSFGMIAYRSASEVRSDIGLNQTTLAGYGITDGVSEVAPVDYLPSSTVVGIDTPTGYIMVERVGKLAFVAYNFSGTRSGSTSVSFTLPVSQKANSGSPNNTPLYTQATMSYFRDDTISSTPGFVEIHNSVANLYTSTNYGAWSSTNDSAIRYVKGTFCYITA